LKLSTPAEHELSASSITRPGEFGTGKPFELPDPAPATTQQPLLEEQQSESLGYTIQCPLFGNTVSADDVDGMWEMYSQLSAIDKQIYAVLCKIRRAVGALTEGTAKTRRVKGKQYTVKVEMPDEKWNSAALKQAWHMFPQYRDKYLRIAKVDPQLREVRKLANMVSTEEDWNSFRDMITGAKEEASGDPRITIEE